MNNALSTEDLDVECGPVPSGDGEYDDKKGRAGKRTVDEQCRRRKHEDAAVDCKPISRYGKDRWEWEALLNWAKMNHSSRCSGRMPCNSLPIGPRLSFNMLRIGDAISGSDAEGGRRD